MEKDKIKIGMWLRTEKGSIVKVSNIDSEFIYFQFYLRGEWVKGSLYIDTPVEKWIPSDEWCWFWDEKTIWEEKPAEPFIAKFSHMSRGKYKIEGQALEGEGWSYCEPFFGTLPSLLREKDHKIKENNASRDKRNSDEIWQEYA